MKKRRNYIVILLAAILVVSLLPVHAFAEDENPEAQRITSLEFAMENRPYCGTSPASAPEVQSSVYVEDEYTDSDSVLELIEAAWISEYSADGNTPFEGIFIGDEFYKLYLEYAIKDGFSLSEETAASEISLDFTMRNCEVLEAGGTTLKLVVEAQAEHGEAEGTYESKDATCVTPGTEDYDCSYENCPVHHIHKEGEIDEEAHQWGDWEIVEDATTLKKGVRKHVCTLCGKEQTVIFPKLYSKVYEPETSWQVSATIGWRADSSALETAGKEQRPATAFVWLDKDLKVYDRDGGLLSDDISSYVQTVSPTMITAFYISDAETAKALKSWLQETGFEDCFVVSTPDNKDLVKDVSDLVHVRGMLDYSGVLEADRNALLDMIASTNGAHGKVIVLSENAATKENVRMLQSLGSTVWVRTSTDTKTILTQYTNGVNGVVVDDYEAALSAVSFFQDDQPSVLRVPFIIGHKGDPSNYAENTIESAKGAFEEGADAIENDIFLSSDGQLFIRHDESMLSFLNRQDPSCEDFTLEELKGMPFLWEGNFGIKLFNEVNSYEPGYGKLFGGKLYGEDENYAYKMPALREYLGEFKGKDVLLDVEIKSNKPEIVQVYKALVDEFDAWDQVFTITFNEPIMAYMYQEYPELSIGALDVLVLKPEGEENYPYNNIDDLTTAEGADAGLERLMNTIDRYNATYNPGGANNNLVKAGRHRGLTVWPWTYSLSSNADAFAEHYMLGVSGLTMNEPWAVSGFIEDISSNDVTVKNLNEVPKPYATTKVGEQYVLENAELVMIEDLNASGTEKLAIWRYLASMDIDGTNYGSYYLYSNPFTIVISEEKAVPDPGQDPKPDVKPDKGKTPVPHTGDSNDLFLWIVLICAAIAGLGVCLLRRNRSR